LLGVHSRNSDKEPALCSVGTCETLAGGFQNNIPKMVAGMLLVLDERGRGCVQTRAHGTSEWES